MRCPRLVPALSVSTLVVSAAAFAADPDWHAATAAHVRPLNAAAAAVLADASPRSATIRRLMAQLDASDLIAYVQVTPFFNSATSDTRFLSAAGGRRYVVITINTLNAASLRAAWLAHELQHALEVANAPEVVSTATLEALYRRIGRPVSDTGWETEEAISTGHEAEAEYAATPTVAKAHGAKQRGVVVGRG